MKAALAAAAPAVERRRAIAWSDSATVGNIAVAERDLCGRLGAGLLSCQLNPAGKFRNGAPRRWCRSHQCHWGVKADLARQDGSCRAAATPLRIAIEPLLVDLDRLVGDGILRLALEGDAIRIAAPTAGSADLLLPALAIEAAGRLRQPDIVQLNLTPPALAALARADGCVDCARCGYPHLDLGAFTSRAHRRHTCGHCGHDATHSSSAIVSNPLWLFRERIRLV